MELKINIIVDYVNYSKRHSEGFECEYYSWLSTILCNKLSFSKTSLELETDLVINKKTRGYIILQTLSSFFSVKLSCPLSWAHSC